MLYFFIASHFLGDYILQTDRLFYYKKKYKWGILLHASIVGVIPFFVFYPYIHFRGVFLGLILNWISHIIIDYTKNIIKYKNPYVRGFVYILDQMLHIAMILVVFKYFISVYDFSNSFYDRYAYYALLFSFLIWVSFGIFYMLLLSTRFDKDTKRFDLKYKFMDMLERVVIFLLLIELKTLWWLLILFLIYRFYVRRREKLWFINSVIAVAVSVLIYDIIIGGLL